MTIPPPNEEYEGLIALHVVKWDIKDSKQGGTYLQLQLSDGGFYNIVIESIAERIAKQAARTLFAPPLVFKTQSLLGAFLLSTGVPLVLKREIRHGTDMAFWNYNLLGAST